MFRKWFILLAAAIGLLILTPKGKADPVHTAPDFTLPSIGGKTVSLHDFAGKTVIVNFWASWCDSCQEEIPDLTRLKEKYGDQDIVFLGINAGDSNRAASRFIDKTDFSYEILMDHDKSVAKRFHVLGLPQTLVISKEGKIVYRQSRPPEKIALAL